MTLNKKDHSPMSLDDLPEYLKSLKENGTVGDSCVVDMGTIIEPKPKSYLWLQRIVLAIAVCTIAGTGGMIAYDLNSTKQLTVMVSLNIDADPTKAIPEMIADSGAQILAVTKKEGSSAYEVKVSTRKSRKLFLEWIIKNKNVEEAK